MRPEPLILTCHLVCVRFDVCFTNIRALKPPEMMCLCFVRFVDLFSVICTYAHACARDAAIVLCTKRREIEKVYVIFVPSNFGRRGGHPNMMPPQILTLHCLLIRWPRGQSPDQSRCAEGECSLRWFRGYGPSMACTLLWQAGQL